MRRRPTQADGIHVTAACRKNRRRSPSVRRLCCGKSARSTSFKVSSRSRFDQLAYPHQLPSFWFSDHPPKPGQLVGMVVHGSASFCHPPKPVACHISLANPPKFIWPTTAPACRYQTITISAVIATLRGAHRRSCSRGVDRCATSIWFDRPAVPTISSDNAKSHPGIERLAALYRPLGRGSVDLGGLRLSRR